MSLAIDVARSLRNATPGRRRAVAAMQLASGYDSAKDTAAYARATFEQHFNATGARGRVLEIGPGGNVAVAALYVKAGADSATCIDSIPWIAEQDELYRELGVEAVLPEVEYLSPVAIESCDLATESFDIIYSHATLEHVSNPGRAVANIARMLAVGGRASHQIDLRDHRDFDRPLTFLRHRSLTWRLLSAGMWMPPNRLRASDWIALFERHGLKVAEARASRTVEVDGATRRGLARPFREKAVDDLRIVSLHLVATKR